MPDSVDGRIRLIILGGYLGSGKTTWLRHQLHAGTFKNAYVIVNEAAETPVDDALLGQSARLSVLAGGCCCCTGKPELIALLRSICDEQSRTGGDRLREIVLETSGLADPAPIIEAIRADMVAANHMVVHETIVAVDALNALAQLASEPLGRKQIEVADRFIVTKVDEAKSEDVARLLATLARLNPGASMSGGAKGSDAPLPDFSGAEPHALAPLASSENQPPPFPVRLKLGPGIDWTAFSVWLSALLHARGDDVVRVKGVVRTPAGRLLIQAVRKIVQSPEVLPPHSEDSARDDDTIVVIGRGYGARDLERSLKSFAGVAEPSAGTPWSGPPAS